MYERRAGYKYIQYTKLAGVSYTLAGFAVLITTDISLCTQAGLSNFIHQPSAGLWFFCDMLIKQTFKWQCSTLTAAFKVVNDIDLMDWLLVFLIYQRLMAQLMVQYWFIC